MPPLHFISGTRVKVDGRKLLYFAGTNYLGLSWDPQVRKAFVSAAAQGPLHPGSSRAATGEHERYRQVEAALARFFRFPSAIYVNSGYLAPLAAAHALRSRVTTVFLDDRAHAALADAAQLTLQPVQRFEHGNIQSLKKLLGSLPRGARPALLCDGTFATRGGISPLKEYLSVLPGSGLMLVDDAHGAGAVGPRGRGALAAAEISDPRIVETISLAKAFGVTGGAVLGSSQFIADVREHAAPFVGTTSALLPTMAAISLALKLIERNPERVKRLQANALLFHQKLIRSPEIQGDPRTPVTAVHPVSRQQAAKLRRALLKARIFPPYIHYLGGPASGFFRFAMSSEHEPEDVQKLARTINSVLSSTKKESKK